MSCKYAKGLLMGFDAKMPCGKSHLGQQLRPIIMHELEGRCIGPAGWEGFWGGVLATSPASAMAGFSR